MSHPEHQQRLEFKVEGQFLGFVGRDGKLKYLRLGMSAEAIQIKLPKELRVFAGLSLQPGEYVRVIGVGKFDPHTHAVKLKATQISPCAPCNGSKLPAEPVAPISGKHQKPKISLLVCQKSGCLKKGGKGLCAALEQALRDRNLADHVTIKRTGCLKRCSAAPNLIMTPGKQHFTKVQPNTVTQITNAIAQRVESYC